jgi:ABC-2 type transport system permease protein
VLNYIRIETLRMLRNKRYIIFVVGFPVAFYLLFSGIYGDQTTGGGDAGAGLRASIYLMVAMGAYGALAASLTGTAVPWAQERQTGWLRQLQVTPLAGWMIITTKIITALLLVLPSVLLVFLAAAATRGVTLSAGQWAGLVLVLWLGALPFVALGLTIGSLLRADAAQSVSMIFMFALAILGALWFPVEIMPATMASIAKVMPSYHYAQLGQGIASGAGVAAYDVVTVACWAVALGAVAIFAYRRATVRA